MPGYVPPGQYTITYGDVPGYTTPSAETKTLPSGGWVTFTGEYVLTSGTIQVQTNLESASFTVSGPGGSLSGSGMSQLWESVDVGDYTITYGDVPGYVTPPSETRTLSAGETVTFSGSYVLATGTIRVQTNVSNATFTVSGPYDSLSGSGTSWLWTDARVGEYTVTYDAVRGYQTPPAQTIALTTHGSTIAFTGTYVLRVGIVLVSPNTVSDTARYDIFFVTGESSGGLAEDAGIISITFPEGTALPGTIPANTVMLNGTLCSSPGTNGTVPPAPMVTGQTVSITTPVSVAAGVQEVTVVFAQAAGIINPTMGSTTFRVQVTTSDPAMTAPPAIAPYAVTPKVTLSPTQGARGSSVAITGRGFGAGLSVDIRNTSVPGSPVIGSTVCGANGAFSAAITIPAVTPAGANLLRAVDGAGTASPTATFTVTPSLTLTPSKGVAGTIVQLGGSAFAANSALMARVASTVVALAPAGITTTATGAIPSIALGTAANTTIVIPQNATPGTKLVAVTDAAGGSASAIFEVVAQPLTLTPSSGAAGTQVTISAPNMSPNGEVDPLGINDAVAGDNGDITIDGVSWLPAGNSYSIDAAGNFSAVLTVGAANAAGVATARTVGAHTVQVVDSGGRIASAIFTITPGISLDRGWNFVSTPRKLAPDHRTAAEVFGGVDTAGHSIWLYDNGDWTAMQAGDMVEPLDGIWVYSADSGVTAGLVFDSEPLGTPPTRQLEAGWNAIGFSDIAPAAANSTLTSVEGQWAYLIGLDAARQEYPPSIINNDQNSGSHDEDNLMLPTQGYWLYMTSPKELAGISAGSRLATQELKENIAGVVATSLPVLPTEFLGTVTLNRKDAPAGTQIVAMMDGMEVGSLNTTEAGIFGQSGAFGDRLVVNGREEDIGRTITFYVNGSRVLESTTYQQGKSEVLSLSVTAHPLGGDVGGDGKVDIQDLVAVAVAFNSHWRDAVWDENADFNKDGRIDIFDLALAGLNFGRTGNP